MAVIRKLGFFHFGELAKARPVRALIKALEEALQRNGPAYLDDALVVLPEAFNIRSLYNAMPPTPNYDPSIIDCLRVVAAEFTVQFVAGLVIEPRSGNRPFNSAYFIGLGTCELLSRKRCSDQMEGPSLLYMRCEDWLPIVYRCDSETAVAALICSDARKLCVDDKPHAGDNSAFHEALKAGFEKINARQSIICVPANLCGDSSYVKHNVAEVWPDRNIAVANSNGGNPAVSIIRLIDGCTAIEGRDANMVVVIPLGKPSPAETPAAHC